MRPRFAGGAIDLRPEEIVRLEDGRVVVLDQRRLPDEEAELECRSAADVADAIRTMAVRGAPAIGVAAAYGYALAAANGENLDEAAETLVAARPTAVNLSWAVAQMQGANGDLAERARDLHRAEVERCRRMGEYAVGLLYAGSTPLTHCNAGGLATGGYGSALGAVKAGFERGLVSHVFVDETRPLLQGGRLTAWELERAGIPASVIADSAAASLMSAGEVSHVITGADRIARNGDTANKIGTYSLAVLAAHHELPFYVVAPTSTLDRAAASGADIPIEERDSAEVSERFQARNPAFDVTPAKLITAIVTEEGVHRPPYEESLPSSVSSRASGKGAKRADARQYEGYGERPRASHPEAGGARRGRSRALSGESPAAEEGDA
ncbi:MAG TPA: S-methyl-5-thioribose-1-phosphate isomerase [Gaiellaceae bacterium]|jgi:methylthioribose-1-phosphate isomerase